MFWREKCRFALGVGLLCWFMAFPGTALALESAKNTGEAPDQISAVEYDVYTGFFTARPPAGPEAPQFFDSVPGSRLLNGRTMKADKSLDPAWLGKVFGALDPSLLKDYLDKNRDAWKLANRIKVPHLKLLSREDMDARMSFALRGKGGKNNESFLQEGIVSLSRVGLNSTGDTALFGVAITDPGAMRAGYVVLMQRKDGAWGFVKVVMEGLIYQ